MVAYVTGTYRAVSYADACPPRWLPSVVAPVVQVAIGCMRLSIENCKRAKLLATNLTLPTSKHIGQVSDIHCSSCGKEMTTSFLCYVAPLEGG